MKGELFFGNILMWKEQILLSKNIVTKDFSALISKEVF